MLDDLYRDLILEHYRDPLGSETVESPDHHAEGQNPLCGDECSVAVALSAPGGKGPRRVEALEYRGRGCSISVASGSMMAGEVKGRTLEEVAVLERAVKDMLQGRGRTGEVDLGDIEALEGVSRFPVRVKCALLPWTTLREALSRSREGGVAAAPSPKPVVTTEDPSDPATAAAAAAVRVAPAEPADRNRGER